MAPSIFATRLAGRHDEQIFVADAEEDRLGFALVTFRTRCTDAVTSKGPFRRFSATRLSLPHRAQSIVVPR